nr:MAG TPA: DNA-directed RNA polymerase subunit [Caudoviricetes sp.]
MARPIDAYQAIDIIDEWLDSVGTVMVGKGLSSYGELIGCIEDAPTLTPQNEPLPVLVNDEQGREYIDYICPRCKGIISQRRRGQRMETVYQCKFHDNCGQRVDWENQQSYRRPPEGEEGDANRG